jgi:hypothetical protein
VASRKISVTETPGDHTLKASFNASDLYAASQASRNLRVARDDSVLSLRVGPRLSRRAGYSRILTATLKDADSTTGLGGRSIVFYVNGKAAGTATTSNNGVAIFTVRNTKTSDRYGSSFTGDAFYLASSTS